MSCQLLIQLPIVCRDGDNNARIVCNDARSSELDWFALFAAGGLNLDNGLAI